MSTLEADAWFAHFRAVLAGVEAPEPLPRGACRCDPDPGLGGPHTGPCPYRNFNREDEHAARYRVHARIR